MGQGDGSGRSSSSADPRERLSVDPQFRSHGKPEKVDMDETMSRRKAFSVRYWRLRCQRCYTLLLIRPSRVPEEPRLKSHSLALPAPPRLLSGSLVSRATSEFLAITLIRFFPLSKTAYPRPRSTRLAAWRSESLPC